MRSHAKTRRRKGEKRIGRGKTMGQAIDFSPLNASSHSGRRTFLTNLANKGTAIHILKTLAGHRSISTTAAYLYSSPSQLKAAVELC